MGITDQVSFIVQTVIRSIDLLFYLTEKEGKLFSSQLLARGLLLFSKESWES